MKRMNMSTGKVIALGATLAVALLALAPGAWAPALAQTAGTPTSTASPTATPFVTVIQNPGGASQQSTTVSGTETTTLGDGSTDGGVALTIPATSMPPGSTVTVTQPAEFAGFVRVDTRTAAVTIPVVMNLEAVDSNGNPVTEFDEPVTVRVNVPNSLWTQVLRVAKTSNPTVRVQNTNPATGKVTTVECTLVDAATGVVDCALPHFSEWGLEIVFEVDEGTDPADITSNDDAAAPSPADTGMGLTEESGGTNPLAIALGVLALAGALGVGARLAMGRRSA